MSRRAGPTVLVAQDVASGRVEQLSLLGTLAVVALNLGLGLLLIVLKLVFFH